MKNNVKYFLLSSLVLIACSNTFQSNNKMEQTDVQQQPLTAAERDSLKTLYLVNGAWQFSLYSVQRDAYLDSVIALVPNYDYLYQQRAMPLFKQRKYELGLTHLAKAVDLNPSKWLDYQAFMKCIFVKDYKGAINDFKAARSVSDGLIMDHSFDFYIGLSFLQLNAFDSANYYLSKSISEESLRYAGEPHFLESFYQGIVLYETEKYAEAIDHFNRCLDVYSTFSDAKLYKALCLKSTGKTKMAIGLFEEAKQDWETGYTINEDNALYEKYPYQLDKMLLEVYQYEFDYLLKSQGIE